MNYDQFIEKLQKEVESDRENVNAFYTYDENEYQEMPRIRIRARGMKYCPITYLANRLTSQEYAINNTFQAAEALGVSEDTAWIIIDAADAVSLYLEECRNARQDLRKIFKLETSQKECNDGV